MSGCGLAILAIIAEMGGVDRTIKRTKLVAIDGAEGREGKKKS
jgi:hypothetical protein